MKNNYILALASAFFFFGSIGVKAQTILDEDFETENTDAENNILWLIGQRLDNRLRISENTKKILTIEFICNWNIGNWIY